MLMQLVDSHKDVFYGSSVLALDVSPRAHARVDSATTTATAESTLLPRFVALTHLDGDAKQRKALQILWQQTNAVVTAAVTAGEDADASPGGGGGGGGDSASSAASSGTTTTTTLLKLSTLAFKGLLSSVRGLLFDIVCLPVDECVAEIAAKIFSVSE